jgi:hypothetical protein
MQSNTTTQDKNQRIINALKATGYFNVITRLELYNNVILVYDQDEDPRLKGVVDRIKTPYLTEDLMVAYECDGTLTLIWKDKIPELFSEGKCVAATYPNDPFPYEYIDYWHIGYSVTARSIEEKYKQIRLKKLLYSAN